MGTENKLVIQVECYAGYRGAETPQRLTIGSRPLEVIEVLDRWIAPDHRYFKLRCSDGGLYIVRYDESSGEWELSVYKRAGQP